MNAKRLISAVAVSALLAGCSARDPVTRTPRFHVGTPTNRSSINSWEIDSEPYHTQPGIDGGQPVTVPTTPPSGRYVPSDQVAESVYRALLTDGSVPLRYLAVSGIGGRVRVTGTVESDAQRQAVLRIARSAAGVKAVDDQILVVPESSAAR